VDSTEGLGFRGGLAELAPPHQMVFDMVRHQSAGRRLEAIRDGRAAQSIRMDTVWGEGQEEGFFESRIAKQY
jgi:hypothetical protein